MTKVNPIVITHYFSYSTPWIFIIVLLSMLTIFALYWIFILIIRPLTRKSNTCRYILPCYKSRTDFLIPATDIFLDIVHVSSGETDQRFCDNDCSPSMFSILYRISSKLLIFNSLKRFTYYIIHRLA